MEEWESIIIQSFQLFIAMAFMRPKLLAEKHKRSYNLLCRAVNAQFMRISAVNRNGTVTIFEEIFKILLTKKTYCSIICDMR